MPGPIKLLGLGSILSRFFVNANNGRGYPQDREVDAKRLASQERLAQIDQERHTVFHEKSLEFQKQLLQEEMNLRRELASDAIQFQLLQAREQREVELKVVEEQWRLEHWPLGMAPVDILGRYPERQPYPLKVFLAPPELTYDPLAKSGPMSNILIRMENALDIELQKFLQQYYPLDNVRPVEFIDGAWSSKKYHGRSSAIILHNRLKSEPMMILELIDANNKLNLKVAYWGISTNLQYNILAEIPLHHIMQDFARKRLEVQKQALDLVMQQENYDIAKENRSVAAEQTAREQNELLANVGANPLNEYTIAPEDIDNAIHVTVNVLCLITAWFADLHHLFSTETPEKVLPRLPRLLSDFLHEPFMSEILRPLIPDFVATYRNLADTLKDEQPYYVSALALHLAEGLSLLPEKVWAQQWIRYAMIAHLETFGISNIHENQLLATYIQYVDTQNVEEINLLKRCLANLEDHKGAEELERLESDLRKQLLREDDLNA